MENLCSTCLERLPTSVADQSHMEAPYTVQCDENFMKILYINTGIEYNTNAKKCPKQLCQRCYVKIMAFDEFRDTALCCATALHELLLEEDFSIKTLNNLQHFCCTCLTKLQILRNTTSQLKNIAWKRWLEECIILKERTAVKQWPTYLCDSCYAKLKEFIQFEQLAKQSLKKIEIDVEEENNKEYEVAKKEINKKPTSKIESGVNQISSTTENKDGQSCSTNFQGNNETNGEFVAEQNIVNKQAYEKEYDFNETTNTLENTRKWVEKTTENVIIHCKKKRKQRSRRKKAAITKALESLECLNTLAEVNGIEVSANTCKEFRENTDTCYAGILKNDMENNELTTAKSDALVDSHINFGTLFVEIKERGMKVSNDKTCKNDYDSLEDVSMSSKNKLISNISIAPGIIGESSNSNLVVNALQKGKNSEMLITDDATFTERVVKENVSVISSNESGANKQPKIEIPLESTADITATFIEDASPIYKNKDTAVSENDIHIKMSLPTIVSMRSNDNLTYDESLTPYLLIGRNTSQGQTRKHSFAKSEESNTAISKDVALNQQPSTNTVSKTSNNERTSTKKLPEQDMLVENICTTFIEEEALKISDAENCEIDTPCRSSSAKDIAMTSKNKSSLKKPSKRDTSAHLEVNAESSADIILNPPRPTKNITNVSAQSTTDIEPMHVEQVERKYEINSEDAIFFKPSSKKAIKKSTKKKQKLQNNIGEAESSADSSHNGISTESKFPDTLSNSLTSTNTSKVEISDETPRNIFSKDVNDIGLNGEKSHSGICKIANNEQNSSKNIAKPSKKKSASKKKSKQDISAKDPTGMGSMHIEDVELKQKNNFGVVKTPSDTALITEQEASVNKNNLAESLIEDTPNQLSFKINTPEASYNKSESPKDIESKHLEDVGLKTDAVLIVKDERLEKKNSESSVNSIFNQLSSTNNISEALNSNSTPEIPSKEYISDDRPTDILSIHMVDVVVKVQNIDSVVSAGFILKQPRSTTNSAKASYKTPTPKKKSERNMPAENLKDAADCMHIENGELKVENNYVNIPEAALFNQASSTKAILNRSKNKSRSKKLSKPEVSVKSLPNVTLNSDAECVDKKSIQDESSLDAVLTTANSTYNIADTPTSKPTSQIIPNQDTAVENPTDVDCKHLEDTWRNNERSHAENAPINEPNSTTNISKTSNKNSKSKTTSKRRDMYVDNPKNIESMHTEGSERNDQHNYANISEDAIPIQQSSANIIPKSSNNELPPENAMEPAVTAELPSDAMIRELENSEGESSVDSINQLCGANNVAEPLNNNTTEENISDESPTGISSIHVEELRLKFDKGDSETSAADNLNEPIPKSNIAEASITISPSKKLAKSVVSFENPADVVLITEDERLGKRNSEAESSVDAVNQLSIEEGLNNSSSPKEPLKNISAESSTNTDFMHVKDIQLKNYENDTQNYTIDNLYQPSSTKNIAIASDNMLTLKKSMKRHKLVETPSEIDSRHAYNIELDDQKSDPVNTTNPINSAKKDTKALDGKLGKFESAPGGNLSSEISEDGILNQLKNIANPLISQPTTMHTDTSVGNSTGTTQLENVGLKDKQIYADISEEATFTQMSLTQNMSKLSKPKTMSKRPSKRGTSPQTFKDKHSTRVKNESEKSDIHNFETDSLKKRSSTYINTMASKHKSTSRYQEKSNFLAEELNQQHRSRKNISHESNRKIPSNKPTKSEKKYKSHANLKFTPYEDQSERNRYTKIPSDSYGNEKKLTKVSMTSSYSKWPNNVVKSDMYVEAPSALDPNFSPDPIYYRRDPVSHTPFRNPNLSRNYSMQRHPYETHEMSPNSFAPYPIQNYYQCLACMKTFKRRDHLSNHRRFSPRCSRII